MNLAAEQLVSSFLLCVKELVTTVQDHEKSVILMMNEIYIQLYLDYKGGTIVGVASNTSNAADSTCIYDADPSFISRKCFHVLPIDKIC